MSSYPAPVPNFIGIDYNGKFFTDPNSTVTLAQCKQLFLARTGNATSIASSTTFNGLLSTQSILPITTNTYNLGSANNMFANVYANTLNANNIIVQNVETQNNPLYLLNSVPTSTTLNAGLIVGQGISTASITSTSCSANVITITSTLNPGIGATISLFGLTTYTELNELEAVVVSSTGLIFTFALTHANYTLTADTGTAVKMTFNSLAFDKTTNNLKVNNSAVLLPTATTALPIGNGTLEVGVISLPIISGAITGNIIQSDGGVLLSTLDSNNLGENVWLNTHILPSGLTNAAINNVAIGNSAGHLLTSGANNVLIGNGAGAITSGTNNTCVGNGAGSAISTSSYSTFIGAGAGNLSNAGNTVSIGYQAGNRATGNGNTLIGFQAGSLLTSGSNNVCIGSSAGSNFTSTEQLNVCLGGHPGAIGVSRTEWICPTTITTANLCSDSAAACAVNIATAAQAMTVIIGSQTTTSGTTINGGSNGILVSSALASSQQSIQLTTPNTSGTLINSTLDSSSSTTGALITSGGMACAKQAYIGTNANIGKTLLNSNINLPTPSSATPALAIGMDNNAGCVFIGQAANGGSIQNDINNGGIQVAANSSSQHLLLQAASATGQVLVQTTTDASNTSDGALTVVGGLSVGKKIVVGTSILLPTSGGTPTGLSYYEEYTHNSTLTYSGDSSVTASFAFKIVRIGSIVFVGNPNINLTTGTGAGSYSSTTGIPARFRPTARVTLVANIVVISNNSAGIWTVNSADGIFSIYPENANFTGGTANNGMSPGAFSYLII